mgnify:FL=1
MVEIVLKDGSKKQFADSCTLGEAVAQISNSLARKVLVAKVNNEVTDLRMPLIDGSHVEFLTFDSQAGKDALRHTASHIMAQAVRRLFKNVKVAIGPAIETGFYYDFDTEYRFTKDDFAAIEKEMHKIVKENLPVTYEEITCEEALELFGKDDEIYLSLIHISEPTRP